MRQLERETATVAIDRADAVGRHARARRASCANLTGHKFPTGYPSRRAWLHVTVRDARTAASLFESGGLTPSGLDRRQRQRRQSRATFEPHYEEITQADQVQIYESIMGTPAGTPTTGLLQATQYLKDNRLLPRGFDKTHGAGGDCRVRRRRERRGLRRRRRPRALPDSRGRRGRVTVDVELRYQPIGYRWAQNLATYGGAEPKAFLTYYDSLAPSSSLVSARATRRIP